MKKNREILETAIRHIGDSTGKGRRKEELVPRCNIIVIGETEFGKGSTAARSLIVRFTEQIDNVEFDKCQDEKLLVSTFYYYYITWYVSNYTEIQDWLIEQRKELRGLDLGFKHRRSDETYFYLNTAFTLYLQYCYEKGFVEKADAEKLQIDFRHLLVALLNEQDKC